MRPATQGYDQAYRLVTALMNEEEMDTLSTSE